MLSKHIYNRTMKVLLRCFFLIFFYFVNYVDGDYIDCDDTVCFLWSEWNVALFFALVEEYRFDGKLWKFINYSSMEIIGWLQ